MHTTYLRIQGGVPLRGTIKVSGAKNSALKLMLAAILTDKEIVLENVPDLSDVHSIIELLKSVGADVDRTDTYVRIKCDSIQTGAIADVYALQTRSSLIALGPLLARIGYAQLPGVGGDKIGMRAIDMHIDGLQKMGVHFNIEEGIITASAPHGLAPISYSLRAPSVGATENLMLAAVGADGITQLQNVAREPEIVDIAEFLKKMGVRIEGAGTPHLIIYGTPFKDRKSVHHQVVPDRIEAGSYALAALVTRGDIHLQGIPPAFLPLSILAQMGAKMQIDPYHLHIQGPDKLHPCVISTGPYPGLASDLQPQVMAALAMAEGESWMEETLYESRFHHIAELRKMGACITPSPFSERAVLIKGTKLKGGSVEGSDIRAVKSLVLAGLAAEGETCVYGLDHLNRGYERLEEKLNQCGARIERILIAPQSLRT